MKMKAPALTQNTDELNLAENLKIIMQSKNMSASELSKSSGVSMATLSRILSGQVNPSISNMVKISQAMSVSLDILAGHPTFSSIDGGKKSEVPAIPSKEEPTPIRAQIQAVFLLENTDYSPAEAAKLLTNAANGSWITSWTDQFMDDSIPKVAALNTSQKGTRKVAVTLNFPDVMIEEGSITSLLSVIGACVTSTGARIQDIHLPAGLLRTFRGPSAGIRGLRDSGNKYGRPLLSATMRPMTGIAPKMYGRAIYETLRGGVDFTCDPSMMHSIPGCKWRERFRYAAEAAHTSAQDTNEAKSHAINVSAAAVEDMLERAVFAKELGMNTVMVDSAAIGWSALESLSRWCAGNDMMLCAMGSRAMQTRTMSEHLLAKLLRLAGCDIVSVGSPLRGSGVQRRLISGVVSTLRDDSVEASDEGEAILTQHYLPHAGVMPACGGGHNPWHFPRLLDALGDDMIVQCGGSVMGHPWGGTAGSTACRVAIERLVLAREEGQNLAVDGRMLLQQAARYSNELKAALEYWQEGAFLFGVVHGQRDTIDATVKTFSSGNVTSLKTTSKEDAPDDDTL